jgi:hypothetical protein
MSIHMFCTCIKIKFESFSTVNAWAATSLLILLFEQKFVSNVTLLSSFYSYKQFLRPI